jgi:hypothetical protein
MFSLLLIFFVGGPVTSIALSPALALFNRILSNV